MAMLAEARSRQKWSEDPRNTRWANDKTKFGYQMMAKMGWSEGKGLGQNESGQVAHVQIKKRKQNSGIGAKHNHDDDWISHQNDFNDLLTALNKGSTNETTGNEIKSLEDRVKSSRKKILYTKFVKSKDLSNASSHDLACIFGTRASKPGPIVSNLSDEGNALDASAVTFPPTADHITEHGFTTVNTGVSMIDYFAKKMAALKKSKDDNHISETAEINKDECLQLARIQKNKKSKQSKTLHLLDENDTRKNGLSNTDNTLRENLVVADNDVSINTHKRRRHETELSSSEVSKSTEIDFLNPKKKKKKFNVNEDTENKQTTQEEPIDNYKNTSALIAKKKKKKKPMIKH